MDPGYDAAGPYPDHLYLYTGPIDAFHYAATRPLQWPPGTVGRYRNIDVAVTSYLVRLAVEQRGEDYWSFPHRALFDPLGIRTMVMDTDVYGNFLTQGYELASARDWARLATLSARWNGMAGASARGYASFVSTLAWAADRRPSMAASSDQWRRPVPVPADAGAGGQFTIIPRNGWPASATSAASPWPVRASTALALLLQAVPEGNRPAMRVDAPLGVKIGRLAVADPDRPALTCGSDTRSRAELQARTNRLARAYANLGVTRDSFVTIGLPNGIEFFEATVAAWKLGATPQPISSRLPAIERSAIIDLADSSLVVGVDPAEAPGRGRADRLRAGRCRPIRCRR
jgi:hypothetical protein